MFSIIYIYEPIFFSVIIDSYKSVVNKISLLAVSAKDCIEGLITLQLAAAAAAAAAIYEWPLL